MDAAREFDPVREWIKEEIKSICAEASGGTEADLPGDLGELPPLSFVGLLVSIETFFGESLTDKMHLFEGTTVDDFADFVVDQVHT